MAEIVFRFDALGGFANKTVLCLSQVHHRYQVRFGVPRDLLPKSDNVVVDDEGHPNPNCRLLGMEDSSGDASEAALTVELTAHKEKLQKETVVLTDGNNGAASGKLSLVLQARVLGNIVYGAQMSFPKC